MAADVPSSVLAPTQEIIYSTGGKFLVNWFTEAGDGSSQRGPEDRENPSAGRAVPTADGSDELSSEMMFKEK